MSPMRAALLIAFVSCLFPANALAAPAPPTNLRVEVFDTTVVLFWTPPSDPASYVIEAGTAPGFANLALFLIPGVVAGQPLSFYSAQAVQPGTYFVRMRSVDQNGFSAPSNEIIVTVGGSGCLLPPPPPTLLPPRQLGGVITLQWVPGLGTCFETTYTINVGRTPGVIDVAVVRLPAGTTSVFGSLPPGVYYAFVGAQNSAGVGPSSNVVEIRVQP